MFQPIQIASIIALNGPDDCVKDIVEVYRKRRGYTYVNGLKEQNRMEDGKTKRDHVLCGARSLIPLRPWVL